MGECIRHTCIAGEITTDHCCDIFLPIESMPNGSQENKLREMAAHIKYTYIDFIIIYIFPLNVIAVAYWTISAGMGWLGGPKWFISFVFSDCIYYNILLYLLFNFCNWINYEHAMPIISFGYRLRCSRSCAMKFCWIDLAGSACRSKYNTIWWIQMCWCLPWARGMKDGDVPDAAPPLVIATQCSTITWHCWAHCF